MCRARSFGPGAVFYVEVVIRGCVRWLRSCEGGGHMTTAAAPAALGEAGLAGLAGLTWAHGLRSAVVSDGGVVVARNCPSAAAGHEYPTAACGQRRGGIDAPGRGGVPPA